MREARVPAALPRRSAISIKGKRLYEHLPAKSGPRLQDMEPRTSLQATLIAQKVSPIWSSPSKRSAQPRVWPVSGERPSTPAKQANFTFFD